MVWNESYTSLLVRSCSSWIFQVCTVLRSWRSWILQILDPNFSFYCGILEILDPNFFVVRSWRSWILTKLFCRGILEILDLDILFCHGILRILDLHFGLRHMSVTMTVVVVMYGGCSAHCGTSMGHTACNAGSNPDLHIRSS